ncbi:hypothetical protein ATANTOWER_003454 [Ataeniobius toweri]|uniref:DUF5641 domain-containing protein n=1 Tax=Ataeniobius toweri TaxID=208326 RepID=A0ABU7BW29_9TELE|nr:hypothetical protein [Ataeniobius toweri]
MMKGEDMQRNEWRLARVSETTTDQVRLVRKVKLHVGNRRFGRGGERIQTLSEVERAVQQLWFSLCRWWLEHHLAWSFIKVICLVVIYMKIPVHVVSIMLLILFKSFT